MKLSGTEPPILAMAQGLGVPLAQPVDGILEFCRKRIFALVRKAKSLATIWDLERIVCNELNLTIHEIHTDGELENFVQDYAGQRGETVIASLSMELEGACYGVLFRLNNERRNGQVCYVAFVDCRGEKAAKRFFTRWHEIAHCLTFFDQGEMVFRRTTAPRIERDPIERLMDMIAAELGFFEPLFGPVLRKAVGSGGLTFAAIETIRSQFCPDASFEATLNACLLRMNKPVVVIEACLSHKKAERELMKLGDSLGLALPPIKKDLRVQRVHSNEAARTKKLVIPQNMRVPEASVIFRCFYGDRQAREDVIEDLSLWNSSKGGHLPPRVVRVSSRSSGDRVIAIIQDCTNPVAKTSRRASAGSTLVLH